MKVEFHRTGERRYAIRALREGEPTLHMDPAPGFDELVPHDLFHFIVERELGVRLGVFGQLAAGGDAGTFYLETAQKASKAHRRQARRIKARGQKLAAEGRADAAFSERAVGVCETEWAVRVRHGARDWAAPIANKTVLARGACSNADRERLSDEAIGRVCARLHEAAERWSEVAVGELLRLDWE